MRAATRKRIPRGRMIKSLEAYCGFRLFFIFQNIAALGSQKTSNSERFEPPEDPSDAPFGAFAPVMPSMKPQVVQVLEELGVTLDRKKTT